jgi:hypothetical protein
MAPESTESFLNRFKPLTGNFSLFVGMFHFTLIEFLIMQLMKLTVFQSGVWIFDEVIFTWHP